MYFAFPDGVFDYVCAECTALCCRNAHAFSAHAEREVPSLIRLYPSLAGLAVGRSNTQVIFPIPLSGCVLLDSDNRCRIEKEHGQDLKPSGCRIFPFNVFKQIGKTITVRPNFHCPLRLRLPARPGAVEGTHDRLERMLVDSGVGEDDIGRVVRPAGGARASLQRELLFRDLCSAALGTRRFRDTLLGATSNPDEVVCVVERALGLLGGDPGAPPPARDAIDDLLLALAPSLRLDMIHMQADTVSVALAISERLLRRSTSLLSSAPTPQTAWELLVSLGPAARLLARGSAPLDVPKTTARKAPSFGNAEMVFAGHRLMRDGETGRGTLDALESAMERVESVSDRSAFVVQMGGYIEEKQAAATR